MNKAKLLQSIFELHKAVESGNMEMMCHCANSLQGHYTVAGKPAKHLYVIGNGFDLHHGAQSGYMNFRRYL